MTSEGVLVTFDVAAALAGPLRRLIEADARANGTRVPPFAAAVLDALDVARRAVEAAGTADSAGRYRVVEGVDVTTFAAATGRDPRSVRRSCARGTLPAWRDDRGRWLIDPQELT